ncbi:WecB/TagA/CpsF family glycosyltransferase [bacterium]|nr:WecB/TagA/CpsF family glycosyltransferase [bacterium]
MNAIISDSKRKCTFPKKEDILGFGISIANVNDIVKIIDESVQYNEVGKLIFCANPHSMVVAQKDEVFSNALKTADILLPDGAGVVLALRILKGLKQPRVGGPDVFFEFSKYANSTGGHRYFFLGSTEEVLTRIERNLAKEFPNISLAGTYSPPFGPISDGENDLIIKMINESMPTVLWVGMTAPKQEKWTYQHKDRLEVPVIGAVGAVFDFLAGTKQWAPKWIRDRGLDWAYRLIKEPKRLWKRNFTSTPMFFYLILKQYLD